MNDPRIPARLRHASEPRDALVHEMLDAARSDAPPPGRTSRMVGAALAIATTGAASTAGGAARPNGPAAAEATASGATGAATSVKIALLALVGAGLVALGVLGLEKARPAAGDSKAPSAAPQESADVPRPPEDLPNASRAEPVASGPAAGDAPPRPDPPRAAETGGTARSVATGPKAAKATPVRAAASSAVPMETPAPSEPSIAAQLAYLREARARLARGDAAGALAALDRYPTEFPGGALAPEVSAMAVDAALAAGRTGEARARADKFLAEHGTSPQAPRIRRLRERLDNP